MARYEWGTKDKKYNRGQPDQELELFGTNYSLHGVTSPIQFYKHKIVVENGRLREDDSWEDDTTMPDPWEQALQKIKW